MVNSGHQVASHTWSHQDLSTLTTQQLQNQLYYNEMAFRNILGYFPQYMRPPYSSCNAACQSFLATAGYHVIYFDLDTEDYLHNTDTGILVSEQDVTGNLSTANDPTVDNWLVIGHDIDMEEANVLTEFMLQTFTNAGFKLVTVGECLNDPSTNWYRTASGAGTYANTTTTTTSSAGAAVATGISSDGQCGPLNGGTCLSSIYGSCCSSSGWCGSDTAHCGTGCQSGAWGLCGNLTANLPSNLTLSLSPDGTCGSLTSYTCLNSGYGDCCSSSGWCGSSDAHCGGLCQSLYGTCTSSSASNNGTLSVSTDASCGGTTGYTCLGSTYGDCCSSSGWW